MSARCKDLFNSWATHVVGTLLSELETVKATYLVMSPLIRSQVPLPVLFWCVGCIHSVACEAWSPYHSRWIGSTVFSVCPHLCNGRREQSSTNSIFNQPRIKNSVLQSTSNSTLVYKYETSLCSLDWIKVHLYIYLYQWPFVEVMSQHIYIDRLQYDHET